MKVVSKGRTKRVGRLDVKEQVGEAGGDGAAAVTGARR